jgi:signal transduction histidine kinase/CheY-like chemotaxis protein
MKGRIVLTLLERETDIVEVRKRTRRLAELFGFDVQDQTRITTAVSEIARNALEYGRGGRVEWLLGDGPPRQRLEIVVSDKGRGIAELDAVLAGTHVSTTGMGIGLNGARRLMDQFEIESLPGFGTTVRLAKLRPARAAPLTLANLKDITAILVGDEPADPVEEIRRQNQEILLQLAELQDRQEELGRLNQELQDTNRGVVALYAELDERADHLRRADELKSKFLSNMSHEFRTPLNSIMALSRLLLSHTDGGLVPEQEKQVQFIRKAAESLTELVNDLLDLARVEAGKTVVTPAEFSVAGLFGTLRGMLRPLLVGDAVALFFDIQADIPPLYADEGKVSQILRNFISNSLKFTELGEVRVWASFDAAADTVTIHVSDTGIGIAEKDIEAVFQEFGQIAHPIQTRVKGTGLGLPLSKKLAELLRGSIAVESVLGEGSTFSVTLPRHYPTEADQDDEIWQLDPDRVPVLAVEDSPADAFAVERMLANSRYQVLPVRSIAAGKRALATVQPAAILLDVMVGAEECWRFMIELKQNDATCNIPLIVASSTGDENKALHLGADRYFHKPIDPDELLDLLDRVTGHRSSTRILLVDDEEVSRYLVRQLLPRGLYHIEEATSGTEGLAQLREQRYDLVLVDLNMPGMGGAELLERFRTEGDGSLPIPAIVLTAAILSREEQARLGAVAPIVSKADLSTATLTGAIEAALAERRA